MMVDCTSKDQGWASFNFQFNGTYQDSNTWSELAVQKRQVEAETVEVPPRFNISRNVRASRDFHTHRKCFSDPEHLVSHVELGDMLQLFIRSAYPGWINTVKYAKIAAYFTLEIDEDYEFSGEHFVHLVAGNEEQNGTPGGMCNVQ